MDESNSLFQQSLFQYTSANQIVVSIVSQSTGAYNFEFKITQHFIFG
jgi:hypothetical protein